MDSKYFVSDPFTSRGCAIVLACLLLFGAALIMVVAAVAWRIAS